MSTPYDFENAEENAVIVEKAQHRLMQIIEKMPDQWRVTTVRVVGGRLLYSHKGMKAPMSMFDAMTLVMGAVEKMLLANRFVMTSRREGEGTMWTLPQPDEEDTQLLTTDHALNIYFGSLEQDPDTESDCQSGIVLD